MLCWEAQRADKFELVWGAQARRKGEAVASYPGSSFALEKNAFLITDASVSSLHTTASVATSATTDCTATLGPSNSVKILAPPSTSAAFQKAGQLLFGLSSNGMQ